MPTLIRSERQTLRAIQEHRLLRCRRAGAAYTQISTVGVVYHSERADASLNLVTPHQGVAWTRGEDLKQGFKLLERRGRTPRLEYLRGLFPEAFSRQLVLYGLQHEAEAAVWLYSPIQGPFPAGESPFGRPVENGYLEGFNVEEVNTQRTLGIWLRMFRSAAYGVDIPSVDVQTVEALQQERVNGDSIFILGYYHNTPIAALQIVIGPKAAEIIEPAIIAPWSGMGFEEMMMAFAMQLLQMRNRETVYIVANNDTIGSRYLRLGFIQITQVVTYVQV
ncbi:MAG: hypothetical protein H6673_12950 [Anaerolineales bacterium]|nr:hypothetical protein [Anaerolineales bacterium]